MIHIVLLLNLISLIVGSWGALYSHQMYKRFDTRIFRSYTLYIIFFNGIILLTFIYIYVITNLLVETQDINNSLIAVVAHLFDFFIEIGMVFYFLRVIADLRNRNFSRWAGKLFIGTAVILAFILGAAISVFMVKGNIQPLRIFTSATFFAGFILFIFYLTSMMIHGPDPGSRISPSVSRMFATFYLAGYLLFILTALLPQGMRMLAVSAVYLMMNVWPLFWINAIYLPSLRHNQILLSDASAIKEMADKYGLSDREKEIFGLLLQGKTYKDIESALYISINTVRNHVHNLYKKMGVGSRSRLIHLVLELKNEWNENGASSHS